MLSPTLGVTLGLAFLAGLVLVFAWWAHRLRQGIRLRPWLLALLTTGYLGLFLLVEAEDLRLPWGGLARLFAIVDFVLVLVVWIPAYRHSRETTELEHTADGFWRYRGRLTVPAIWLGLFLLRFATEAALLGKIYLFTPAPSAGVSIPTFAFTLMLVDAMLAVSSGVLLGNALGVYGAYRRRERGFPPGLAEPARELREPSG